MVGDWNGPGRAKIGVFNSTQAVWLLDYNGSYTWDGPGTDQFVAWGSPGDIPVVGDWNGSGTSKIAVFNPSQGWWVMDYNGNYARGRHRDRSFSPMGLAWGRASGPLALPLLSGVATCARFFTVSTVST